MGNVRGGSVREREYQCVLPIDGAPQFLISDKDSAIAAIAQILLRDKLWPVNKPSNRGVLVDETGEIKIAFPLDASTEMDPNTVAGNKVTVAVVSLPYQCERTQRLDDVLSRTVPMLSKHGVFYVLEYIDGGDGVDKSWRLDAMGDHGLVERGVLVFYSPWVIWRGRMPIENPHQAINLVELWKHSDDPSKRTRLHEMAIMVKQLFWQNGYKVVCWDAIFNRLQATRNVCHDLQFLREGYGIRFVNAACGGCVWERTLTGQDIRIQQCGDPSCEGIATTGESIYIPHTNNYEELYELDTVLPTTLVCWDCDGKITFMEQYSLIRQGSKSSRIQVHQWCPSCNAENMFQKSVPTEQVRWST